jgi:hypothetical protein
MSLRLVSIYREIDLNSWNTGRKIGAGLCSKYTYRVADRLQDNLYNVIAGGTYDSNHLWESLEDDIC